MCCVQTFFFPFFQVVGQWWATFVHCLCSCSLSLCAFFVSNRVLTECLPCPDQSTTSPRSAPSSNACSALKKPLTKATATVTVTRSMTVPVSIPCRCPPAPLCLPLPVSIYPFLCPDTALSSPSWLGSFCMPCKQQQARGHTNRWHFHMSQGLPLPVSVYTPILCPDTVLMSPSWMGFFDMQTTMDDSGNLKNNTWCSNDGNGNSTCSSSGCSSMLHPRYIA